MIHVSKNASLTMSLPQTNLDTSSTGRFSPVTALVLVAVFAIFIVIYVISRQTPQAVGNATGAPDEEKWRYSSEGRAGKLAELRGKEHTHATTYGWVDQKAGIVRLPVDRAVELTIRDLNASRK